MLTPEYDRISLLLALAQLASILLLTSCAEPVEPPGDAWLTIARTGILDPGD
jgi:hypothetical protein